MRSRNRGVAYDERTGFKVRGEKLRQDGEKGIWTTDPDPVHPQRFLRNPGPDGRYWTPGIAKNESHGITIALKSSQWSPLTGLWSYRKKMSALAGRMVVRIGATLSIGSAIHVAANPFIAFVDDDSTHDDLTANNLSSGTPSIGTPALTQIHALSGDGVDSGAPSVGTPIVTDEEGEFDPANLPDILAVFDASDSSTLFQSNAGTTAVGDGDPVGYFGNGAGSVHLTSVANNTTRPTYHVSGGIHWVEADGSNDILRATSALGMYAAGACSVFFALRSNAFDTRFLFGERSSSSGNPIYQVMSGQSDADDLMFTARNDSNTFLVGLNLSFIDEILDDTDVVAGFVDNGSTVVAYEGNTQVDSDSYTRSGAVTVNRTSLFAAFASDSPTEYFSGRLYAMVIVGRAVNSTERSNIVDWLKAKAGMV